MDTSNDARTPSTSEALSGERRPCGEGSSAARSSAPASALDLDELQRRQSKLRGHGRLHWMHWAIVAGSVIITVFAWNTSRSLLEQRAEREFDRQVAQVIDLMRERMAHYEDALLSGVASIMAIDGAVTRARWKRYADNLQLLERYPGISGIGVIFHLEPDRIDRFVAQARQERPGFSIQPQHGLDFRLPITYIEPEPANAAAIGLDVAFEKHRRSAALRARRLGTTQVSGPIELVQDAGKTPGFLFYAPYYDAPSADLSDRVHDPSVRESRFRGLVYAPLIVERLIAGTLDPQGRDVQFSIHDGDETLYDELDRDESTGQESVRAATRSVRMYGRVWTFDFRGPTAVGGSIAIDEPLVVLVSGLTIDAMLLGLFLLMSRSNRRVLALAEQMTGDLARHAQALSDTNAELQNYAHIVSHDLKTPIRGIQDLTDFLKEDLGDYLASGEADPEIAANLDRLDAQALKGQALITGILDYSSVGVLDEPLSRVDVRRLIEDIGRSLNVSGDRLLVSADLPVFETHAVRLGQVFSNLIGNAFKYHHDPLRARVRVSVQRQGAFYAFQVRDDGPGIKACHHQRIFQTFTTLQLSGDMKSSGIGLSIVRKSVELLGGQVGVESTPGQGAAFRFTWPVESLRNAC